MGFIGSVKTGNKAYYRVASRAEIEIIISIFTENSLNTTKHLNFLAFAKAFWLNHTKGYDNNLNDVNLEIESLKSTMNSNRSYFNMPNSHKFVLTSYWLLGFIEGDGSFSYQHKTGTLVLSITQKENKALLDAVLAYLLSLAKSEDFVKGINEAGYVYFDSKGGVWNLRVMRGDFIEFVIIPLFNSMIFRTKKYLDYLDWVAIFNLRKKGLQYTPEGQKLIDRILNQMNNNRLSTSSKPRIDRAELILDLNNILSLPSNYEYKENGKIFIISENRYLTGGRRVKKAVALLSSDGDLIKTFPTATACSRFLGVDNSTVTYRLKKGSIFLFDNYQCYLKEVVVSIEDN